MSIELMAATERPFVAADHQNDGKHHLLLAASGSVATIKIPNILHALAPYPRLSIRVILTSSAAKFLAGQSAEQIHIDSLRTIANVDDIFLDDDERTHLWTRKQSILHIELRRWADILVIAPLSANTLAKVVGGFSDNLLTSVVRAWDTSGRIDAIRALPGAKHSRGLKHIIVAPAMNTAMWEQPITKKQIDTLENDWGVKDAENSTDDQQGWFVVLRPQEKDLACGDVGSGAMKEWTEIVRFIWTELGLV